MIAMPFWETTQDSARFRLLRLHCANATTERVHVFVSRAEDESID